MNEKQTKRLVENIVKNLCQIFGITQFWENGVTYTLERRGGHPMCYCDSEIYNLPELVPVSEDLKIESLRIWGDGEIDLNTTDGKYTNAYDADVETLKTLVALTGGRGR